MSKDVIAMMLFVSQEGCCFHCGEEFVGKAEGKSAHKKPRHWTRDHLKLACQGHGRGFNIVLACGPCNFRRGNRPPTSEELARADVIFEKVRVIWRSFYGKDSPVWPMPTVPLRAKQVSA